jgi:A/G-specific adenine glycosylase
MLQQTRAVTASSYYLRFIEHFPNLKSLAKASEQEILTLWAGLGYYKRAKNLHKAAREIIQFHNGVFPTDFKTILALPGIGRYTAGAICSLAYNQSQPIVDGNIRRVITRFNAISNHAPESYFWKQMKVWIPDGKASIFNQSMMELGALVCAPARPHCTQCPIRDSCKARALNLQDSLPQPRLKKPARNLEMAILAFQRRDKILATSDMPDFIPGEWSLPSCLIPGNNSAKKSAECIAVKLFGSRIRLAHCGRISHVIGHRRIAAHIFTGETKNLFLLARDKLRWINRSKASEMLTSSLFLKALSNIEAARSVPES